MTSLCNRHIWASLGVLLAVVVAGCDDWNDRGSLPLSSVQSAPGNVTNTPVTPTDTGMPSDPPVDGDAGTTPTDSDYETMCRNYCGALEQTSVYGCIGRGQGDAATCGARFAGHEDLCWELRCLPRLVEPSLCLVQCDALAVAYESACGASRTSTADTPFACATPPAVHDAACRAGCAPAPPLAL